jgi:hypothetical protein
MTTQRRKNELTAQEILNRVFDAANNQLKTNGIAGGDVSGPGAAVVDDNIVTWNGTGGTDVQDSGVAISAVALLTATQTLTNKTLTLPTIGDFTNATHAHAADASGGTIAHSATTGQGTDDHHAQSHNHSAAGDGTSLSPATLIVPSSATPAQTAEGSVVWDSDDDVLTVGTGAGRTTLLDTGDIGASVQAYDATLASIAGLGTAADKMAYTTGVDTWAEAALTSFARTVLDDADAATARTTLGVDAAGTDNSTNVTLAGTPDYLTISGQEITRGLIDLTTDVTGVLPEANLPNASTTAEGVVEHATVAELETGTDANRVISPDVLAGSNFGERVVQFVVFDFGTATATGDGKFYFHVPSSMTGMDLVEVHAEVITAGTTGTTDIQLHNVTAAADILSTKLTIDSGETGSDTAATAAVISTSEDDVATNDVIRVDVDAVSTTPANGLIVTLTFRLP